MDGLKNRMFTFQEQISKLEDCAEYFCCRIYCKKKKLKSMKEKLSNIKDGLLVLISSKRTSEAVNLGWMERNSQRTNKKIFHGEKQFCSGLSRKQDN